MACPLPEELPALSSDSVRLHSTPARTSRQEHPPLTFTSPQTARGQKTRHTRGLPTHPTYTQGHELTSGGISTSLICFSGIN